jgi:alanine racemase
VIILNQPILRSAVAEINLVQLKLNFNAIRQKVSPARVMPMIKANAYGHGLVAVARHMEACGADMLGVAILDEGIALRQAGISLPVLVVGGVLPEQIPAYVENDLILTVPSLEILMAIEAAGMARQQTIRVHIKFDTGMGRLGVPYQEAERVLAASLDCSFVQVDGIYSHLANSDIKDLSHARLQLQRFNHICAFYTQHGLPVPLRHIANSGAILQMPESYLDMVRPGILLYGYYPASEVISSIVVQPVLSWKAQVSQSKIQPSFHPVSYGSSWQSDHPVRILTIPVGYGDGYFRSLSNRGEIVLHGKRFPIVGRVCMDQFMVNVEDEQVALGEEVILIGEAGGACLTADDLANWVGTISYEVLTNISARVPRIYIGD